MYIFFFFFDFFVISDQRSNNLPIVNSAITVFGIVAAYLYIVLSLGPRLMEKRQPFQIKNILIVYNTFQMVANVAVWFYVSVFRSSMSNEFRHFQLHFKIVQTKNFQLCR